ncbi:hypothetical protein [Bradyrhizobium sp. SRS-191]|uniref:hypothetical protein n=1 Tax=Bradyrhizobium sp. SRS-191 TaxID=2962606 RepID=UPI00211F0270|nr:hypothetical protein [Bradyrhizobium sp. SRS-191]
MEKIVSDNNFSTFADDTQIVAVNAAGTSAATAAGVNVPNNFRRVIIVANRVDASNYAVALGSVAIPGQEVEIHPVGGDIEVFPSSIPTFNQNFLDGSPSFVTARGAALRGISSPSVGLNAWSRLG